MGAKEIIEILASQGKLDLRPRQEQEQARRKAAEEEIAVRNDALNIFGELDAQGNPAPRRVIPPLESFGLRQAASGDPVTSFGGQVLGGLSSTSNLLKDIVSDVFGNVFPKATTDRPSGLQVPLPGTQRRLDIPGAAMEFGADLIPSAKVAGLTLPAMMRLGRKGKEALPSSFPSRFETGPTIPTAPPSFADDLGAQIDDIDVAEALEIVRTTRRNAPRPRIDSNGDFVGWETTREDIVVAWSGTGAKPFKKFSLEFVGTGERSQVFSWGLYFAEAKGTAGTYNTAIRGGGLSPVVTFKGEDIRTLSRGSRFDTTQPFLSFLSGIESNLRFSGGTKARFKQDLVAALKDRKKFSLDNAKTRIKSVEKNLVSSKKFLAGDKEFLLETQQQLINRDFGPGSRNIKGIQEIVENTRKRIARGKGDIVRIEQELKTLGKGIEDLKKVKAKDFALDQQEKGGIFTVRLNIKPREFLDWDKFLVDQPVAVQRKVRKAFPEGHTFSGGSANATGQDVSFELVSGIRDGEFGGDPTIFNYVSVNKEFRVWLDGQGLDFDDIIGKDRGTEELASRWLNFNGLPGMKAYDRGSRGVVWGKGLAPEDLIQRAKIRVLENNKGIPLTKKQLQEEVRGVIEAVSEPTTTVDTLALGFDRADLVGPGGMTPRRGTDLRGRSPKNITEEAKQKALDLLKVDTIEGILDQPELTRNFIMYTEDGIEPRTFNGKAMSEVFKKTAFGAAFALGGLGAFLPAVENTGQEGL